MRTQTTSAILTARGKAPPVKGTAAPRLNATAPAGAIVVIDWNKTPGRPIAFDRNVDDCVGCVEEGVASMDIRLLLCLLQPEKWLTGHWPISRQGICATIRRRFQQPCRGAPHARRRRLSP